MTEETPWRDRGVLRELYWGEGMTQEEIGDELGCTNDTVYRWMKKLGVESRDPNDYDSLKSAYFRTKEDGYEEWQTSVDYNIHSVRVHRLLAVAEYGFDSVVGNEVHHQNNIPWDNRPENIEVLSVEDHMSQHAQESEFWKGSKYWKRGNRVSGV